MGSKYLQESEVLLMLGITKKELKDLRHQHGFPYIKVNNKRLLFKPDEIDLWLNKRKINGGNK